jgi:cytochrome c
MSRLRWLIAALFFAAAALVVGGLAFGAEPDRGEMLVVRHCGGCHAVGAAGASPEPAAPPFRELHRRYDPEMLAEALAEGLLTGHPMMPEFRFPPDDVRAVIRYLQSIQTRQPA